MDENVLTPARLGVRVADLETAIQQEDGWSDLLEEIVQSHLALAAQLQAVTEERDAERERRENAEAVLTDNEWLFVQTGECKECGEIGENRCPICGANEDGGHTKTCDLGRHFAKYGADQ